MDSSLTQPPDANASTPVLSFLALSSFGSTFGSTFGAFMIGTYFSLMLYGITLRQTFQYFHTYRGDTAVVKFLVLAIFLVDTFHTATLVDTCYYYFVTNYFDPFGLLVFTWSVQVLPLTIGIVVLLTQSFYVRRIYLVDRRYLPVVLLVATLMLVEFSFIIASSVESFKNATLEGLSGRVWMYSTLFAIATAVDFILTGALVVILRKNYSLFERTNNMLDTVSLYAVVATSLNSALTVTACVCSIALPQTSIYIAVAMPATKVYSNSVLAVLNCRQALRNVDHSSGSGSSDHVPPLVGMLPHTSCSRITTGARARQAPSDSVSPSSLYAMVRIQVPRMAERMRDGEDSGIERVDGKIRNP